VPLVLLTSKREIMGPLVNRRRTIVAASLIAGLIITLNVFLIAQTLLG
jgi:manganese transport protein